MTPNETLGCIIVIMAASLLSYAVLAPAFKSAKVASRKAADAQNVRLVALAGIMYGGDYDDKIPLAINGRWSGLQNRHAKELTINCPGPGTQDLPSSDAAGARPTRTWVELQMPYLKSRRLLVSPNRNDPVGYFASPPHSVSDKGYDADTSTYRNQGRFPSYGLNYLFLAPIRIPKTKLGKPNAINYAEGVAKSFNQADDPSGTIFFVGSELKTGDPRRGFFVVNAPGMWRKFSENKKGYIAFWNGEQGEWMRDETPCKDSSEGCIHGPKWAGFVWSGLNAGVNATFLDGHVKYMKTVALAGGTSYPSTPIRSTPSETRIVERSAYLWDLYSKDLKL